MRFDCRRWPLFAFIFADFLKDFTESSATQDPAPYYIESKYFWSFDGLKSVQGNHKAEYVQGVLENGIRLSNYTNTSFPWLDLGSVNSSCISKPYECSEGFTVLFWAKINGNQRNKVIVNAAEQEYARGIHLQIDHGILRFSTTGLEDENIIPRTVQRFLDAKWEFKTWIHIGLVWYARLKEMKIFYNCSEAEYTAAGITYDRSAHVFRSPRRFIVGANNELSNNAEVEVDELGIWDAVLEKQDICNVFNARRVHGNYSEWSKFTSCTETCGVGLTTRTRTCTNPSPHNGGKDCSEEGPSVQTTSCLEKECPIDGGYSEWSDFSNCTRTCSGGESIRTRTCTQPAPQYGGRDCSHFGSERQIRVCNLNPCPVHGGYSTWSNFTSCTKSCANGTRSRNRSCDNPTPRYNGRNCSTFGPSFEVQHCNEFPCPVHGGYSMWSPYSMCSLSCDGGERRRLRNCSNPVPLYGGKDCKHLGPGQETLHCNTHPCPVHGGYTAWSKFTSCSKSCGHGTKWRARNCTGPKPEFGGRNCSRLGPNFERISCNTHPCPIHGNYTQWSTFSPCSTTCNNGTMTRNRSCTNPSPKYYGRNCSHFGQARQVRLCNMNECPIDGNYGPWSAFAECSASCGKDGFQTRTRLCDNPSPRFGGRNCSTLGPVREIRACNIVPCPIDGAWGQWSDYSRCSKTCEIGRRFRTRECNKPVPQYGGRNCTTVSGETHEQKEECNTQLCPDVVIKVTIILTSEEWRESLTFSNSEEHQKLTEKILKNVGMFYGTNSSSRKSKVLNIRKGSVLAVLELSFFNRLYAGVMNLQDEIFLTKRLGHLSVVGLAIESKDVPSSPPANITTYNTSSQSIMITWGRVPVSQTNGNISSYTVLHSLQQNTTLDYTETTVDPNTFFLELRGLEIFHPYFVRMLARNRRGEGIPSLPTIVWTDMEAPNAAPEILSVYNLSSTSIFIRWSDIPTKNIRGILQGFILKYCLLNTDQIIRLATNASSRETILENLQKFSNYEINLAGFNRKGSGPENQILIKTDDDIPSKPPEKVHVRNSSSTSLIISWKPIPAGFIHGILKGYFIFYRTEYSHVWSNITVEPESYQVELLELLKYQKYYVQVAGFTRKGTGKPCKQIPVMTDEDVPSGYPSGVLAVNTSSVSLLVQWDPISSAQTHGILLGYTVYYKRRASTSGAWKLRHVSPLSKAVELTNLRKFRKYNIRVAGFTSKGAGVRSPLKVAVTAEDVPSRPVQFVRVKSTSSTSVSVSWGYIPRPQLHGLLRGYKIMYRVLENEDAVYEMRKTISFQHHIQLRGLLKFTTYGIRVIGYTIGDGKASEEIHVTTDQDKPSKFPYKIKVQSRWSSSEIPVIWQPVTPTYYVHGILFGYRIKYKPIKDTLKAINAPYKWITVSPDTLQYTIKGLVPFTTYAIQVLAFTGKGDGNESKEILAGCGIRMHGKTQDRSIPNQIQLNSGPKGVKETCSCQRVFTTNWWSLTPYANMRDGNATGIFPAVLQKAIETCCSDCARPTASGIDFVGTKNAKALQKGILEVNANLGDKSDFHFPIHGSRSKTTYSDGMPYVSLVKSPGAAFIISSSNQHNESERLVKIALDSWAFMLVIFIASYVIGLIMWIIERKSNSKYFPTSFLYGPLNGLWWAVITVTTVGYGDKTPKTIIGRIIAIMWTLTGQVFVVILVAQVTSELSAGIVGVEIKIYGKKIAVIQNSSEYRLGIKKNARYDPDNWGNWIGNLKRCYETGNDVCSTCYEKEYSNLKEIYEDLINHKVFGSLIDTYIVASEQELFQSTKLHVNKIFDYSLNYGVVLGGHARKLQPCLQHYVMREQAEISQIVTKEVKPLKNVLTRNVRVDQVKSLLDPNTVAYRTITITCAAMFGVFFLTGFLIGHLLLPYIRSPDSDVVRAKAREKLLRSKQEKLTDLVVACTQDIKTTLLRTKRRHIKELKSYVKERTKAEKAIQRALKKEEHRNKRNNKRVASDSEMDSDDNLSNISSIEGSVKMNAENVWKDIEPLEGLFSLV